MHVFFFFFSPGMQINVRLKPVLQYKWHKNVSAFVSCMQTYISYFYDKVQEVIRRNFIFFFLGGWMGGL